MRGWVWRVGLGLLLVAAIAGGSIRPAAVVGGRSAGWAAVAAAEASFRSGGLAEAAPNLDAAKYTIGINIFILADGATGLADGTAGAAEDVLLEPDARVTQMVEARLVPAISRIWAQCSVGFRLLNLAVIRPERVRLSQGTLAERLFTMGAGTGEGAREGARTSRAEGPEIRVDQRATLGGLGALVEATRVLAGAAEAEGDSPGRLPSFDRLQPFDPLRTFTVYVTGARLVGAGDERGFHGMATVGGRVSVVRWLEAGEGEAGARERNGGGAPLSVDRNVRAVAHELGHGFGLGHVSPDEDADNLMLADPPPLDPDPADPEVPDPRSDGSLPHRPRWNLQPDQCDYVEPIVRHLALPR